MTDAVTAEARSSASLRNALAGLGELLVLAAVMLGGAYLASWVAGRMGLPVSRDLVFEGMWFAPSWGHFPWLDCAGMLVLMVALPVVWEGLRGTPLRSIGFRADRRAVTFAAFGLLCAAALRASRYAAGTPIVGKAYVGSLGVLAAYWLVAAVVEEVAFRGVLQRRLTRVSSVYVALPVATAGFVLWHGFPTSGSVLALRIAAGLGFGLLYHASGSLLPPILCHWAVSVALAA